MVSPERVASESPSRALHARLRITMRHSDRMLWAAIQNASGCHWQWLVPTLAHRRPVTLIFSLENSSLSAANQAA
jgi:hypothetical protein